MWTDRRWATLDIRVSQEGSGGTDAQRRERREPGWIDSAALIKINDLPPN
jgi:hypothetical protein